MILNIVKKVIYVETSRNEVMISFKLIAVNFVNDGLRGCWLERHEVIVRKVIELYS